jgi:demethylmenaquinone methyltransferase/2-methoxy-6-polyprenyl-1,4-benzoquinol methylase
MSTYVYMRVLESAPHRYDLGMRLLSLGRIGELYREVAEAAVAGTAAPKVLEIGCGTGNLTRALAERGARVTAIDWSPDMLEQARRKLAGVAPPVEIKEMAAVEIADRFPTESFDAVASTLALSEMSEDEQLYVLRAAYEVLRPGGRLVIGDEVRPEHLGQRLLHACTRWPVAVVTYLLTQTSTSAVADLAGAIRRAGFSVCSETRTALGSMSVVVAEKSAAPARAGAQGDA